MSTRPSKLLILLVSGIALSACSQAKRIARGGVDPIPATLARAADPAPATGSLYHPATARTLALAEDRRARGIGDMLTIRLVERIRAQKSTNQQTKRDSQRSLDLPDVSPFSIVPEGLFSGGSSSSFNGSGAARQENQLSGEFTVFVTAVLPNGAMAVAGDRRLMLTRGEEQVQLTGIVRPEDIGPDNRVDSTRIADARLRYTGTGEIAQQARQGWLARFFNNISPF